MLVPSLGGRGEAKEKSDMDLGVAMLSSSSAAVSSILVTRATAYSEQNFASSANVQLLVVFGQEYVQLSITRSEVQILTGKELCFNISALLLPSSKLDTFNTLNRMTNY